MITRAEVIEEARRRLGTPWRHQARNATAGLDCIGLIADVAGTLGLDEARQFFADRRYQSYGRTPNPALLRAACDELMDPVPLSDVDVADVLVFQVKDQPWHFGFLSRRDPDYLLHSWAKARRVVEHGLSGVWRRDLLMAYHLRGVA